MTETITPDKRAVRSAVLLIQLVLQTMIVVLAVEWSHDFTYPWGSAILVALAATLVMSFMLIVVLLLLMRSKA